MTTHFRARYAMPLLVALATSLVCTGSSSAQNGTLLDIVVHSPALEGNLLEDSADRTVSVYLPAGYDESNQRYPVLYLLHAWGGNNITWQKPGNWGIPGDALHEIVDRLVERGDLAPMIFVMPDANNKYMGSHYTNSSVTGNWEDFIVRDLVEHIDSAYRTLPQPASRGIAGHSMGGYGAITLAMKHPEVYSAVYAMSAFGLDFEEWILKQEENILLASKFGRFSSKSFSEMPQKIVISMAGAFAPNPDTTPNFADFPLENTDGEVRRLDSVWQRWLQHDPLSMLPVYQDNLMHLRGIRLDVGTSDGWGMLSEARTFSQALADAGIPHVLEEYDGNHLNGYFEQIESDLLPFFSGTLLLELEPPVLTLVGDTSWGGVKARVQP